jgi:predicted RNase H-like HicB family nuclease
MNQKYLIVIEQADDGSFSAYVPDLPGCTTCGDSIEEVKSLMKEALEFHLEGLRESGQPIPMPTTVSEYIAMPLVS